MQAPNHNGLHPQKNTSTAPLNQPYGDWEPVRRDIGGALQQRLPLRGRSLREAVNHVLVLAQFIAEDGGDCSRVTPEYVAAAIFKYFEQHTDSKTRAVHALLESAEMEHESS